jgi:hypothetical protein
LTSQEIVIPGGKSTINLRLCNRCGEHARQTIIIIINKLRGWLRQDEWGPLRLGCRIKPPVFILYHPQAYLEKGKCRNTVCPLYWGKPQFRGKTVANEPRKDRPRREAREGKPGKRQEGRKRQGKAGRKAFGRQGRKRQGREAREGREARKAKEAQGGTEAREAQRQGRQGRRRHREAREAEAQGGTEAEQVKEVLLSRRIFCK